MLKKQILKKYKTLMNPCANHFYHKIVGVDLNHLEIRDTVELTFKNIFEIELQKA